MHVWGTELKRALYSRKFSAGMAGIFIACVLGCAQTILLMRNTDPSRLYQFRGNLYFVIAWNEGIYSKVLFMILPVLAAVPYASSFFEEWNSRYLIFYAGRTRKKRYIFFKLGGIWLSGVLSVAAGLLVFAAVLVLALPWDLSQEEIFRSTPVWRLIWIGVEQSMILAFNGGLWALVGSLGAITGRHLYLTWLVPFSACYLLETFQRRYFSQWYLLNPEQWVSGRILGTGLTMLWLCVINIVIFSVNYLVVRRRMRDA